MTVPSVPWGDALALLAGTWRQGEHVTLLGSTGSGKTTLARAILPMRSYVAAIATKPEDENLDALIRRDGYRRVKRWPPDERRTPRVVFWPPSGGLSDVELQREAILDVLDDIWHAGRWTVYLDEIDEVANALSMDRELRRLLRQGRAAKITMVGATQRPRGIPLEWYSQATHLFFWQQNDEADLSRITELGGRTNKAEIRDSVAALRRFEVLYVNTRTGDMWTALPPPPTK